MFSVGIQNIALEANGLADLVSFCCFWYERYSLGRTCTLLNLVQKLIKIQASDVFDMFTQSIKFF